MEQEEGGDISLTFSEEPQEEVRAEDEKGPIGPMVNGSGHQHEPRIHIDGEDFADSTTEPNAGMTRERMAGTDPMPRTEDVSQEMEVVTLQDLKRNDLGHKRTDSVPLKRYDVEASIPAISLAYVEEDQVSQEVSPESGVVHMTRSGSETEDNGLDFMDVRLDQDSQPRSPYGLGAHYASRSAVEIRQDSISSGSGAAKKFAIETEERQREAQRQEMWKQQRFRRSSDDGSPRSRSGSRRPSRSVEGRYMGRYSQPASRNASPERNGATLAHSASIEKASTLSLAIPEATGIKPPELESSAAPVMMVVAGEDGEVNLVPTTIPVLSPLETSRDVPNEEKTSDGEVSAEAGEETASTPSAEIAPAQMGNMGVATAGEGENMAEIMLKDEEERGLKDAADKEQGKGKKRRSSGMKPSALEQHMSRTRQTMLPPKPKQEDVKHLHDYEEMMKLSKEKEKKKQQEAEERKRQRDEELQENMFIWKKDVLPSWTRARRELPLRKLWWKGIPPSFRGRLWALACGNNQMLPRNLYTSASTEAQKRIEDGTFSRSDLQAMEADIACTLPSLKLFQRETGVMHDDLRSVLCAFVVMRMEQSGQHDADFSKGKERQSEARSGEASVYPPGAASLVAMLLTNLTPAETLIALLNMLVERPWLQALYATSGSSQKGPKEAAAGFERVFDTLLADQLPKVYANMQARGVRPSLYVTSWVKTLFVPYLPFDLVAHLWDCIFLDEGDALIYRIAIALFTLLSARLYAPDRAELVSILRGNNRAVLSVWHRTSSDGTASLPITLPQSPTSQGDYDDDKMRVQHHSSLSTEAPDEFVPTDDIYGGQYNITESSLFQALEEQSSWWKDSMLERLLDRELVT